MIRNYIKTAFRGLMKNKGFTFINVFGLALGLATCLLIVFYVFDELSYDKYNANFDRIYRINNEIKFGGNANTYATSSAPVAAALKGDYPDIEQVVRLRNRGGALVRKGTQNVREDKMVYADHSIFNVFTLPMVSGNPAQALTEPHTVVISEKAALKYFNTTDAAGRTLTLNDTAQYKVVGVIKNIPVQSHFNFDFFLAMPGLDESKQTTWFSNNFQTYILLKPGVDYKKLDAKMPAFLRAHAGAELQSVMHLNFEEFEKAGNLLKFSLMPLKNIHLKSNARGELGTNGDIQIVYIFSAIAIFILLIACVNFMNLSTARSSNRAREVGVRKVLGSPRKYLIAQFLTESMLITLVATVIAVTGALLLLPFFNQMAAKELIVTRQIVFWLIPSLFIIVIVIGSLAGSYPALFLSAFQPIEVLKGKLSTGFKGGLLRSFLVVFQFSISIFLIIGTIVIYNQLKYIQSKDLGYNRSHILIVNNLGALGPKAKTFKEEIKHIAGVQSATITGALPTADYANSNSFFKTPAADQKNAILPQVWPVDEDYITTLGIKMAAGRNFSSQMLTDSSGIIINESAAKMLAYSNPINQMVYRPMDNALKTFKAFHIVGVMKDFNFQSLRDNVTPLFIYLDDDKGAMAINFTSANIPAVLAQVKDKWGVLSPNQQFDYSFMDKDFDALYRTEQRTGTIFIAFTSLAIIIACLGLFGLAAYATEQRTKEIGIRKVLGASTAVIVNMLSKDFIKLVCFAILIASPLAWWGAKIWLQGYAYSQAISWWIFAAAALGAVLIAFTTVSFQAIKAALTNPVKSLRSE